VNKFNLCDFLHDLDEQGLDFEYRKIKSEQDTGTYFINVMFRMPMEYVSLSLTIIRGEIVNLFLDSESEKSGNITLSQALEFIKEIRNVQMKNLGDK
jgi:hypothetical protein